MTMKLDQLNKWLTLAANIGVIAGIVFLAIEIRQNTQSLQVNAYQQLISQIDSMARLRLQDPDLGMNLHASIEAYPENLSNEEAYRMFGLFFIITRSADLAYYQFQQGALSYERLVSATSPLQTYVCSEAYREFWTNAQNYFVAGFREFVGSMTDDCDAEAVE